MSDKLSLILYLKKEMCRIHVFELVLIMYARKQMQEKLKNIDLTEQHTCK